MARKRAGRVGRPPWCSLVHRNASGYGGCSAWTSESGELSCNRQQHIESCAGCMRMSRNAQALQGVISKAWLCCAGLLAWHQSAVKCQFMLILFADTSVKGICVSRTARSRACELRAVLTSGNQYSLTAIASARRKACTPENAVGQRKL